MKHKNFFLTVCLLGALAVMCGCVQPPEEIDEFAILAAAGDAYFTNYTTPSTGVSPNIAIADLFQLLNDGDESNDPYLIDWRSAEDFAAGHIQGAVNIALGDLGSKINELPTDQMIVNVCYTGQTASFATAVINLVGQQDEFAGLEARNLKFGMCSVTNDTSIVPKTDKWVNAVAEDEFTDSLEQTANTTDTEYEFPAISSDETTLAGIIAAQVDDAVSDWSIDAATVFANTDDYFIINYWPEDQYLDPGHIPGAYQFSPKGSLATDADLNLLPTDQTIVVYCYTGQTSAQVAPYLRMLGYDAKSLLFGVNGFAFEVCPGTTYHGPENDYTSILE